MNTEKTIGLESVDSLCAAVRALCGKEDYEESMKLICHAIGRFPHSPVPHNLLGIVLEKEHDHAAAMKHFRAAWALDPAYKPVNYNLQNFGTFYSAGDCAFDDSDLAPAGEKKARLVCDSRGIMHVVKNR